MDSQEMESVEKIPLEKKKKRKWAVITIPGTWHLEEKIPTFISTGMLPEPNSTGRRALSLPSDPRRACFGGTVVFKVWTL